MKIHAQLCFIAALIGSHYSLEMADDECGVPDVISDIDGRIVSGVDATPHAWPWQVSINCIESKWSHWCGGSVIHRHWVITAAHCVYSKLNKSKLSKSHLKIVLGEHNMREDEGTEEVFEVSDIIPHEDYNRITKENDIALIRLKEDVEYNQNIKPICLPNVDVDVEDNELCVVTGWGLLNYTKFPSTQRSSILQQLEVPVISRRHCNHPDWYGGQVTENMICAGFPEGGKGTCMGDSGGPLAIRSDGRWTLFGVVSWNEPKTCAKRHHPGVYTRVTRYLEWIHEKTGREIKIDNLPKKGTDGSSDSEPRETKESKIIKIVDSELLNFLEEIKIHNLPKKGTDGSSDSEPTETEEIKTHENHNEL